MVIDNYHARLFQAMGTGPAGATLVSHRVHYEDPLLLHHLSAPLPDERLRNFRSQFFFADRRELYLKLVWLCITIPPAVHRSRSSRR